MKPSSPPSFLSPSFQRRLLRTPLRRRPLVKYRSNQTPPSPPAPRPELAQVPSSSALSVLLSRLSLPPSEHLHPFLIACLTHPSYNLRVWPLRQRQFDKSDREARYAPPVREEPVPLPRVETNEVLAELGNSLLGIFASEHLATTYPLLPTVYLKMAVTSYVGAPTCFSVAQSLGVGVQGGGNAGTPGAGRGASSAGVPVRWRRTGIRGDEVGPPTGEAEASEAEEAEEAREEVVQESTARSGQGQDDGQMVQTSDQHMTKDGFTEVVAKSVKAFVALIYQEQGIHAARAFVHAHFLSRHLDMTQLVHFKNPRHVLSSVVQRHLADAGVPDTKRWNMGRIQPRLLASTGALTNAPIFTFGLFLPSGLKLSEGSGSSLAMARHRASVNALLSLYLVRGDQGHSFAGVETKRLGEYGTGLPTSGHAAFPILIDGLAEGQGEVEGLQGLIGGSETIVESKKW